MALSVQSAFGIAQAELWSLVKDLLDLAFSRGWLALQKIFSPSEMVNILAEIPDLMIDRIGETPKRFVAQLLSQLRAFPLDKKLRQRVMTGDAARSWAITVLAEEIALMADPPSRRVLRGVAAVVGGGGLPSLRARVESYLGKLTLSTPETFLARVLGTIASPARFALVLLKIWDLSVQLFITVIGVTLLVAVYVLLRRPEGAAGIKAACLSQRSKRRPRIILVDDFFAGEFNFSIRDPYRKPLFPLGADDVAPIGLYKSRHRIRHAAP